METIGEVSEITGESVFEWRIPQFFSLSEKVDVCYDSPPFSFAGASWVMRIYPNGEMNVSLGNGEVTDTEGYINLFLWRNSFGSPINLEYSLGLKTEDEKIYPDTSSLKTFKKVQGSGIIRLINRSMLLKTKSKHASLTLVCKLKYLNSSQIPRDTATVKCSYCKENFRSSSFLLHEKKCIDKPIKCPECSSVILLQNWYSHECQVTLKEGKVTDASIVHPKSKILQDFKKFFLKNENCDVVLKVKGQEFTAHKAILTARSPVFSSIFYHDMKEKASGIVDIEDCDPSVFPNFLHFLYCGEIDNFSKENVFSLYIVSDKYDVSDLKIMCMEFIKANLSIETFCDTVSLALKYSETELLHLATNFFIKNAEKIIVTVDWQSFVKEYPIQSNELFIKFVASVKCSKT